MKILSILISLLGMIWANAQQNLEQLNVAFAQNPKPIIIQFSTDWCGYCLLQNKKIKQNPQLLEMLENDYYYLQLDAESNTTYHFLQRDFLPNPSYPLHKTHSLVAAFLQENESVAYPFWVMLSIDLLIEWRYTGYLAPNKLHEILNNNSNR